MTNTQTPVKRPPPPDGVIDLLELVADYAESFVNEYDDDDPPIWAEEEFLRLRNAVRVLRRKQKRAAS